MRMCASAFYPSPHCCRECGLLQFMVNILLFCYPLRSASAFISTVSRGVFQIRLHTYVLDGRGQHHKSPTYRVPFTTRPTTEAVGNRSIFYVARHRLHIAQASIMRRTERTQRRPTLSRLYRIALDNKISSSDTSRQAVNHASGL